MPTSWPTCSRTSSLALAAALGLAMALPGCVAAPKLPPQVQSASAAASANAALPQLARRVDVVGPRGRLPRGERTALLAKLAQQGNATLLQRHLGAMAAFGDVGLHAGNGARLLIDGPATFAAMLEAIEQAKASVVVESYIVDDAAIAQRLADALLRKRAQGVQVALLYDAVGSLGTDESYFARLRAGGVAVCAFNPVSPAKRRTDQPLTHRDHRKIVAVDRQVAFTGGINIAEVYSSPGSMRGSARAQARRGGSEAGWRDTHLQLRGPAAAALDDLVREAWREQRCAQPEIGAVPRLPAVAAGSDVVRIVPSRPDEYSRIYALLMTAIDVARRSIHITMAYFAPGDEMVDALCDAASRGVDVQLVLPSRSDFAPVMHAGRAYYERLLRCGAKIHELQGVVLHAKTAVIDGVVSSVGSSNMDYRSFGANNEIDAVVFGDDFGEAMERMFRDDVAASRTITLQAWLSRPLLQRLREALARAFEPAW